MKFLRNLLATIVGLFVFTFLSLFLLILIASSGGDEKVVKLKEKSVLHLKRKKRILEREVEDPFEGLPMFSDFKEGGIGLMEFKERAGFPFKDSRPTFKQVLSLRPD